MTKSEEHNFANSLASRVICCKMKGNCKLVRHARTQVMSQIEVPCCVSAFKCQEKYCIVDTEVPCLTPSPLYTSLVSHKPQKSDPDLLVGLSGYLTRNASASRVQQESTRARRASNSPSFYISQQQDNRRQHWATQNNALEREKELSSGTTGAFHWFALHRYSCN